MDKKDSLSYVTHRINQPRQERIWKTLCKHFDVHVPKSIFTTNSAIKSSLKDIIRLMNVSINAELKNSVSIVDNFMTLFYPHLNKKKFIYEYGSVLSIQLKYLGNSLFHKYGIYREKHIINQTSGLLCINEPIKERCEALGAENIFLLPNYPSKNFKETIHNKKWRQMNSIPIDKKVVLFLGGQRLKSIYGRDLLLDSWKMVENIYADAILVMMCQINNELSYEVNKRHLLNIRLIKYSPRSDVANWINSADICVASRTPSFPSKYHNDKDSTKINEYAAFKKPIIANNYLQSKQYLLVDSTSEAFAEGIMKAIEGKVRHARPRFWEDISDKFIKFVQNTLFH